MNDLENRMVLPVADDMRDGDPERCQCDDCGAIFPEDNRVYLRISTYHCEYACPECGSTELSEYTRRDEMLSAALEDIGRSHSLKSLWENEK